MIIKETDLYQPVCNYFIERGYKVNGEVKALDVTAVKDQELVVIELKKSLNLQLLVQGVKRQRLTDLVYLAVPCPRNLYSRAWKDKVYLTRRLEFGLMVVAFTGEDALVRVVHHPKPFSREHSKRSSKRKRNDILKEAAGRINNYNVGGSSRTKLMTVYKENCLHIACCLQRFGSLSPKKLRLLGTGKKTTSILYRNHYFWFNKVSRGLYQLSEKGREALHQYPDIVDYYFKLIDKAELK